MDRKFLREGFFAIVNAAVVGTGMYVASVYGLDGGSAAAVIGGGALSAAGSIGLRNKTFNLRMLFQQRRDIQDLENIRMEEGRLAGPDIIAQHNMENDGLGQPQGQQEPEENPEQEMNDQQPEGWAEAREREEIMALQQQRVQDGADARNIQNARDIQNVERMQNFTTLQDHNKILENLQQPSSAPEDPSTGGQIQNDRGISQA